MKTMYTYEYTDEIKYHKLEKSIKKYNMLAYKKLIFDYYPALKEGKFLGEIIGEENGNKIYELKLPSSDIFAKVHGEVKLNYTVCKDEAIVFLNTITPESILLEGHATELKTYKGILISNQHAQKDIFKINLLNSMN